MALPSGRTWGSEAYCRPNRSWGWKVRAGPVAARAGAERAEAARRARQSRRIRRHPLKIRAATLTAGSGAVAPGNALSRLGWRVARHPFQEGHGPAQRRATGPGVEVELVFVRQRRRRASGKPCVRLDAAARGGGRHHPGLGREAVAAAEGEEGGREGGGQAPRALPRLVGLVAADPA